MRKIVFGLLIFIQVQGFAQTVSTRHPEFKPLPPGMTYVEFTKLQRTLNWKRIFAASFIPGYIHFYAAHKRCGWAIAGVRAAGYVLIGYSVIDELNHTDRLSLSFSGAADPIASYKARSKRNLYLFLSGIALNMMGYAFDWAHGDFIIERERNAVLYKFGQAKNKTIAAGLWYNAHQRAFGPVLQIPLY